jgi:hypothetical protein
MKCEYIKPNNDQCGANAMTDSKFCFRHNPDTEVERNIATLKGGYALKTPDKPLPPVKLQSINDISGLIEDTINRIRTEPLSHHQANSIGYLSGILLKSFEISEYEKRLEALEQRVNDIKR